MLYPLNSYAILQRYPFIRKITELFVLIFYYSINYIYIPGYIAGSDSHESQLHNPPTDIVLQGATIYKNTAQLVHTRLPCGDHKIITHTAKRDTVEQRHLHIYFPVEHIKLSWAPDDLEAYSSNRYEVRLIKNTLCRVA